MRESLHTQAGLPFVFIGLILPGVMIRERVPPEVVISISLALLGLVAASLGYWRFRSADLV